MKRKIVPAIMLTLLLTSMLTLAFSIQPAKASYMIFVRPDGSVYPSSVPIERNGNVYSFTDNIYDCHGIRVQKNDVIVDGNGYTLDGIEEVRGFDLEAINTTVRNVVITQFEYGVYLSTVNGYTIVTNTITDNLRDGIFMYFSDNNFVCNNIITNNGRYGINLGENCEGNIIIRNTIKDNGGDGLVIFHNSGNTIYHNNIIDNNFNIVFYGETANAWDNGYPSGGNYWSDFVGSDNFSGSYQSETGHDGIVDTSRMFNEQNSDNYPLTHPYGSICNLDTNLTYLTVQSAINAPETLDGHTIFVRAGTYYEHVVVNKTVSLIGENRETTIIDGNGSGDVIVCRSVTDITISNFTIQNGQQGLDLTYSHDCLIADNRIIHHSVCGITGGGSGFMDNSILRNTISYCQIDGIRLGTGAQRILVKGNVIANVSFWWALVIDDSWEIIVEENDISNTLGIRFCRSDGNIIRRNTISNTLCGANAIVLVSSNDNVVEGNMLTDNGGGLYVYGVNNTVYQNDIVGNNYGISIGKPDNTIYHNNFINNYYQVWLIDGLSVENQWDNGYPSDGNYWSDYNGTDLYRGPYQNETGSDGTGDTPYIIDADNRDRYPLMAPYIGIHDVAVTCVVSSKTVVGQGFTVQIDVTITNQGDYPELLNMTLYANTTAITTFTRKTLLNGISITINLTWNTTGFAYGNYTVSAYAWPVQGETDTGDNTFTDDTITISHLGDITGDGKCDIQDLARVSAAFGSLRINDPDDPRYGQYWHPVTCPTCPHTPNADITNDAKIDIQDLARTSANFGWHE